MIRRVLALTLALVMLLCGCGKAPAGGNADAGGGGSAENSVPSTGDTGSTGDGAQNDGAETDAAKDVTGQFDLSATGEAYITAPGVEGAEIEPTGDNYRVFYEIFVGSFSDSDGDGTGDLRGIINRMDYLNDGNDGDGLSLGVEGLWLSPIFKSPTYHKYDVDDYYQIDPAFGTEEDLKELLELCHQRNVKVILDLVINHTGPNNDWFNAFRGAHINADASDPYYDFYSWVPAGETPPSGRTFQKLSGCDDLYECNFSPSMPELNYDNDAVRQAVLDVAKYYLDLGVDGFRFDAAKYIYYDDHDRSGEFWKWYIGELKALKPDIYTVAEVWDSDGVTDRYFPALNCFDFTVAQTDGLIAQAARGGDVNKFTSYVDAYVDRVEGLNPDGAMIVPFIANHDTDRAAGYLTEAGGLMRMAANLYILSSGSPFLYYGEEIGARGSRGGANTDANRRLKMEWGDGDTVADPEGSTYRADNRVDATAAEQLANGDSLLSYYKKLIMIRKANPAIARGDYTALPFEGTKVGGFTASLDGETVAVIHNTTDSETSVDLSSVGLDSVSLTTFIGMGSATLEGTALTLSERTSAVLQVG